MNPVVKWLKIVWCFLDNAGHDMQQRREGDLRIWECMNGCPRRRELRDWAPPPMPATRVRMFPPAPPPSSGHVSKHTAQGKRDDYDLMIGFAAGAMTFSGSAPQAPASVVSGGGEFSGGGASGSWSGGGDSGGGGGGDSGGGGGGE